MPVAEQPQHIQALAHANRLRLGRAEERKKLAVAAPNEVEAALLKPTEALATYKLGQLFGSLPGRTRGIICRFGKTTLVRTLNQLTSATLGRVWSTETRLGDLTERERKQLVAMLHPYLHRPGS